MTREKWEYRAAISNAYYDARNRGRTMEQAADDAADAVMALVAQPVSDGPTGDQP